MSQTGAVGMEGQPCIVEVRKGNPEALKYGKLWTNPEGGEDANLYRKVAPGEDLAQKFLELAQPKELADVIDFGCGTGRGGFALALLGGMRVTMVDFVNNCLDEDVRNMLTTQAHRMRFVKADLEQPLPPGVIAEYGYCTDVMEHIPPDKVDDVLKNILLAARHVFFSIATQPDSCGKLIGETLHLTVQPFSWWLEKFQTTFGATVHYAKEVPGGALFYLTAWAAGKDFVETGVLNTTDDVVIENVKANIADDWKQVHPHITNDLECMVLGGGPSLLQFLPQIKEMREQGAKLITLNGAYNWALDHGLTPSAQIIVDAREFNKRFVDPIVDKCIYLIASQCHPEVFKNLPHDRTFMWHTAFEGIRPLLKERYEWSFPVPGGSTVLLRAIPLMRTLGYRKFHLFGCDSCLAEADGTPLHHAYPQPENDKMRVLPVGPINGRMFYCHPWMISQCEELQNLIRLFGNEIELEIYGDGLLANLLQHAANLQDLVDIEEAKRAIVLD